MKISRRPISIFIILGLLVADLTFTDARQSNSTGPVNENQPAIDFDQRLDFYLNLKSKGFVKKMATKEQFLLQFIQNITREIAERGTGKAFLDSLGFTKIYAEHERLIQSYSAELEEMLHLLTELEQLENYVVRTENTKLLDEIQDLKSNLKANLENRQLFKKQDFSSQYAVSLIQEYSTELDSILDIYDALGQFEAQAHQQNDSEILAEIENQKQRIIRLIGTYRPEGAPADDQRLVKDYLDESDKVVGILKEVDQLNTQMTGDSLHSTNQAAGGQDSLLAAIDGQMIRLSGIDSTRKFTGPTISELFDEWRAQKIADYQLRLTQYRIVYTRLLQTGSPTDRERMLERAMSDAMMNYTEQHFDLAEMQFSDILKHYHIYFPKMDGVLFYIAESNYAQSFYDVAFEHYDLIVNNHPDSKYTGQVLWKLMVIAFTYEWNSKFFTYFEKLQELPNHENLEEMNQAYYLAGYMYATTGKFKQAQYCLQKIASGEEYYLPGQYLLGIVYVNLDNYNQARTIFETLAKTQNYPWSGVNLAVLRNEATIRLGFLYYQRGEYQKAMDVLSQVSKGFHEYDKSLMVQAWAKLKTGQYEASLGKINDLFSEYLSSGYTYEALVLSAHCKQILSQPDAAKRDLKYVTSSIDVMKLTNEYNLERKRIIEQSRELERLENMILERQDAGLYTEAVKIRDTINEALLAFHYRGVAGSQLIDEFNDERKEVIRQIEQFDGIIESAEAAGKKDIMRNAMRQRDRLIQILDEYKSDRNITNINYFIDHPLATQEGGIQYRRGIVKNMFQEIMDEKKHLERDIQATTELLTKFGSDQKMSNEIDLEMLEEELADLHKQLNRLQIWLAKNPVNEIQTNFQEWADFSGFGMSDINFSNLQEKDHEINTYSQNILEIERLLSDKRKALEDQISDYDKKMARIEKNVNAERVRLEKLERKKYFENIYFDTKQHEVQQKGVEEDYQKMLEEEFKKIELEENLKQEKNKKPESK